MFKTLPNNIQTFMSWKWDQIQPFADELMNREVTRDSLHEWLSDWAMLSNIIRESFNRLHIRTTTHTNDEENQESFKAYSETVMPPFRSFENRMKKKLLESGLEPENFVIPLRKLRSEADLFREENLPILTEIERLGTEFSRIAGARTVNWDGEELTSTQMYAKLTEPDRGIRERAWRMVSARAQQDREAIDDIWVQLLDLRQQLAKNAGYPDYRAYRWEELGRFDYTPQDCQTFHVAIEEYVVPAASRRSQQRKEQLGVDPLRVWDDFWFYRPDSSDAPPLRPYDSIEELNEKIEEVFTKVDPELGAYYHILREESLLDLESRKHKTGGAYMDDLPFSGRPFIFGNAVGTHEDVKTQLHEGGHAFHFFEALHWPYQHQSSMEYMPMEFIEVGSMAMELLAAPYLEDKQGGFYSAAELARANINHLEEILGFWPYMAVVDAFQHWVYENPVQAKDTKLCDDKWETLHRRYLPHLDWSGIEDTLRFFWRQQGHIIGSPFYYIEYGLAQLGAVQIWANALKDQPKAVKAYRAALQLGGTATLPELYETAGAKFSFDDSVLPTMVKLLEKTIEELSAV
jgi:oligoendopeptidase F